MYSCMPLALVLLGVRILRILRRILRLAGCEPSSVGSVHAHTHIYTHNTCVHTHTHITHIHIHHTHLHTHIHIHMFFYKPKGKNRLIISIFHPIQQTSQHRMGTNSLEASWEIGHQFLCKLQI